MIFMRIVWKASHKDLHWCRMWCTKKGNENFFFFTSNALKCTKKQHQKVLALNIFLNTPLPSRTCVEASELVEEERKEKKIKFFMPSTFVWEFSPSISVLWQHKCHRYFRDRSVSAEMSIYHHHAIGFFPTHSSHTLSTRYHLLLCIATGLMSFYLQFSFFSVFLKRFKLQRSVTNQRVWDEIIASERTALEGVEIRGQLREHFQV